MRNKLTSETFRLLNLFGWSYTSDRISSVVSRLEAEGVFENGSGEIISPSGETLASALGRLWGESAPAAQSAPSTEADERAKYDGLTKAEFDGLSAWDRAAIESKVQGPLKNESWRKQVAPVPMQPGDEKLSAEEKIAKANEVTFRRMGVIK